MPDNQSNEPTQLPAPTPLPLGPPIMVSPDMKERIKQAIANHENRIKELKGLQEALDKNPELEKVLELYQQGIW